MSKGKITAHIFAQRGEAWEKIRVGKVGGSEIIGLTTPGRMKNLLYKKAAEILTGEQESVFVTEAMQAGIDNEPVVSEIYEKEEFVVLTVPGYITNSEYEYLGLSPDGIENNWKVGIEIKCPMPKGHVETVASEGVPKDYRPQVAHYFLMLPDLEEMAFLSYNEKVVSKPYFKVVCTREEFTPDITKLKNAYLEYVVLLKAILKHFRI